MELRKFVIWRKVQKQPAVEQLWLEAKEQQLGGQLEQPIEELEVVRQLELEELELVQVREERQEQRW